MSGSIVGNGPISWKGSRDREGHREWKITWLIKCDQLDGPAVALQTSGLPVSGDPYLLGNDADAWAFCKLDATITPRLTKEPNNYFEIELTFSTKGDEKRCKDQQIDDPLLIPDEVSGSFVKYQEEAVLDRFGRAVTTSSHEQIKGPKAEFDRNRLQIKIKQNVSDLQLPILQQMIDTVNTFPIWGIDPRCVKLSEAPWTRKFYGQCSIYYERTLTFDIRLETFDKDLLDEGSKCLKGKWSGGKTAPLRWVLDIINGKDPDPGDPTHFIKFTDPNNNPCKVVLNGAGLPSEVAVGPGKLYMSIQDDNVGNDLSNDVWWIPIEGDPTKINNWEEDEEYIVGELVQFDLGYWIAGEDIDPFGPEPGMPDSGWGTIGDDVGLIGDYDSTATYQQGNYVADQTGTTPGMIRVEKYLESDFTLLNIPLTF